MLQEFIKFDDTLITSVDALNIDLVGCKKKVPVKMPFLTLYMFVILAIQNK